MESIPSPESQPELSPEELEAFKNKFAAGLIDSLDFFQGEDFLILDPASLNVEDDSRVIDELSTQERAEIEAILAADLEIDFSNLQTTVKQYTFLKVL